MCVTSGLKHDIHIYFSRINIEKRHYLLSSIVNATTFAFSIFGISLLWCFIWVWAVYCTYFSFLTFWSWTVIDGIWAIWNVGWECQSNDGWTHKTSLRRWRWGFFRESGETNIWHNSRGLLLNVFLTLNINFFFSFCGLLCLRHSKISFLKEVYISCYKFTLSDMYFLWNIQFTKNILD